MIGATNLFESTTMVSKSSRRNASIIGEDFNADVEIEVLIYNTSKLICVSTKILKSFSATGFINVYACCQGDSSALGCSVNSYHITNDVDPRGFVKTMSMEDKSKETCFALDCEMCYTTRGIELTRITVVDDDGNTTYETFVKPDNKIIDYNTKYDN